MLALGSATLALTMPPAGVGVTSRAPCSLRLRTAPVRMETLASQMFGDVFKGLKGMADKVGDSLGGDKEEAPEIDTARGADDVVADIDKRAQTGDITFDDFMTMSKAFASLDGRSGGVSTAVLPGQLTDAELAETRQKIVKHEKIVEVMLPEERMEPQLLVDDLVEGSAKPGPRTQRLAKAADLPETEVALFVMQFEAMRESTKRIAAGEDPDKVNESMMAGPGSNRAARRAAKKKVASGKKKTKM